MKHLSQQQFHKMYTAIEEGLSGERLFPQVPKDATITMTKGTLKLSANIYLNGHFDPSARNHKVSPLSIRYSVEDTSKVVAFTDLQELQLVAELLECVPISMNVAVEKLSKKRVSILVNVLAFGILFRRVYRGISYASLTPGSQGINALLDQFRDDLLWYFAEVPFFNRTQEALVTSLHGTLITDLPANGWEAKDAYEDIAEVRHPGHKGAVLPVVEVHSVIRPRAGEN